MEHAAPVLVGNGIFVLVMGLLGLRLLRLAGRTRQLPELLLGLALCGIVTAIPLLALSGMGRATVGELNVALYSAGFGLLWISLSAMIAFTWRAFRPEAKWAAGICLAASSLLAVTAGGAIAAVLRSAVDVPAAEAARSWIVGLRLVLLFGFGWTAFEAVRQYRMARRRLALGLGDPIVANRFLLWAWTGGCMVASGVLMAILHKLGFGILTHAFPAFLQSGSSLVAGVLMTLAFMPPGAYLRLIEARHAGGETPEAA